MTKSLVNAPVAAALAGQLAAGCGTATGAAVGAIYDFTQQVGKHPNNEDGGVH